MKKYISRVFSHTTVQQISDFIFADDDYIDFEERDYSECLEKHSKPIIDRLQMIYPDEAELDEAICDLNEAIREYESVFKEIGLKTGVRLMLNLLS